MARGPKPVALSLTATEWETLQALVRRRSTHQDVAMRARIVLACADPHATNTAIGQRLSVSRQSVVTWRQRPNNRALRGRAKIRPVSCCPLLATRWRLGWFNPLKTHASYLDPVN